MVENAPKIFGGDLDSGYETLLCHREGGMPSCFQNTPSTFGETKKTKHGVSSCPSERTRTTSNYALPKIPAAPLLSEGIIGVYRCSTIIT